MISEFQWTPSRVRAAELLSEGQTNKQVGDAVEVTERTIYNWKLETVFSTEVDRLTLTRDVASRAERVRIARRMLLKKVASGAIEDLESSKDPLDILKFIQSETNGAICSVPELEQLAAILAGHPSVTGSGSEAAASDGTGETGTGTGSESG
jgi:hypothetical protein